MLTVHLVHKGVRPFRIVFTSIACTCAIGVTRQSLATSGRRQLFQNKKKGLQAGEKDGSPSESSEFPVEKKGTLNL